MSRLCLETPLWLARRARHDRRSRYPHLRSDLTVDLVVVGGGITGVTAACRFAEAGYRVALVERALIGRGSTAASTALLMQEPDYDFTGLAERYGTRRARRIWQLSRNATHDFVRTLERLRIRCHLAARDSVYYALTDEAARHLRTEHARRRAGSAGGRWLDRAALLRETGIHGAAAIRTRGNAQLDPYEACVGLARAAANAGAAIFERSPVTRIQPSADRVTITTPKGTLRADRVIIATGYATPDFKPLIGRFRMLHTYVAATNRLTARERRRIGLRALMVWDTGRPYHYARWSDDGRLLLGGADRPRMHGRRRELALRDGIRAVIDYFVGLYPALGDVTFEYGWEGLFAMTRDGLPYIGPHRRYPRHLFALGYGGNGMTFGYLASTLLLDWYRGNRTSDLDLFAFGRL
jgi:glycine/D-amino acid oxidase-like deaminating enzyme